MQQVTARYDLSESESQHFTVFNLLLPFFIIALCVLGCMLMKRFTPALYYLLMGQRKA